MILDRQNMVSSAQAVAGTGNLISTDTIDLLQARDIGTGEDQLEMFFQIVDTLAGGSSIDYQVIIADDAALTSNVEVLGATGAQTTLAGGSRFHVKLNRRPTGLGKRYLGVRYVRAGTFTDGTVTAGLVLDAQDQGKNYPSGYTIV